MGTGGLHGAYGVGEHAAVIIRFGVQNAARHETGILRVAPLGFWVGRVAGAPGAALSARVHHEVGVACCGVDQPIDGQSAPAAVADVFDHAGQASAALAGKQQPAFDGLPGKAWEGHVKGIDQAQVGLSRLEVRFERNLTGRHQRGGPKFVKIRWFLTVRFIYFEFFQGQVEYHMTPIVARVCLLLREGIDQQFEIPADGI